MSFNFNQEKVQLLDEAFTLFQRMLKENKFTEQEINFLTRVVYFLVQLHEEKGAMKKMLQRKNAVLN